MKTLTAALILEKNKLYSKSPWITLFEMEIDTASYLRLAAYPEDVTFDGNTYTAFPAYIEAIEENSEGSFGNLRVHTANIDRTISAYVENNNLLGNDVTVRVVHSDNLATATNKLDFTYRINEIHITEQTATFELGHEDLFALRLPRQRYIRGKCRHAYQDSYCRYPGDQFGLGSKQDFTVGGDGEKRYGWYTTNSANIDVADVSVANAGFLTIRNTAETAPEARYWNDETSGFFMYKPLSGNFTADLKLKTSSIGENGVGIMLLCQSSTDDHDWAAWLWHNDTTDKMIPATTAHDTDGGTTTDQSTTSGTTWAQYGRIQRTGSAFAFSWSTDGSTWNEETSVSLSNMPAKLNIGIASYCTAAATGEKGIKVDWIDITGGLASCDYTLDGINGCRVHKNTSNFGGAPALPYGRIYGI